METSQSNEGQLKTLETKTDPIEGREDTFGLSLKNVDSRRRIYEIFDEEKFLNSASELGFAFAINKIKNIFSTYPDGMKQLFIVTAGDEEITLGKHYHKDTKSGGTGDETFIFIDVPAGSDIQVEKYSLKKASGQINYHIQSGAVITNRPYDYHIFTCVGPFSMIQVTSTSEFKNDDLNKFNPTDWPEEDDRLINGHPDFKK